MLDSLLGTEGTRMGKSDKISGMTALNSIRVDVRYIWSTLEQHRFELCESTYTEMFSSKYV